MLQSATGWIADFGIDGLRLDAIHAIVDSSTEHLVAAVARRVHATRNDALVIAESGLNDPIVMRDRDRGGWGCDAEWADDFHHSLRMLLTGEHEGYYDEFGSVAQLAKAWHRPHVHDGNYSTFRQRRFGAPADDVPPERFVVFDQDHDQVGNRAFGDRMPAPARPLAAFCTLLSPFVPLLFMGEEYGENGAVSVLHRPHRQGASPTPPARAGARSSPRSHRLPSRRSPTPRTPRRSSAPSSTRERDPELSALYAQLLEVRRRLLPGDADSIEFDEDERWLRVRRGRFEVICNFAPERRRVACAGASVELATHGTPALAGGWVELEPMSGALVA